MQSQTETGLGPVESGSYTNTWSSKDGSVWMVHIAETMGRMRFPRNGTREECLELSPEKFQYLRRKREKK